VDDGVHTAQRVAEGERIGQLAQRDLDSDPLGSQPPGIAYQAPDRHPGGGQPSEQRHPDGARGAGQEEHPGDRT